MKKALFLTLSICTFTFNGYAFNTSNWMSELTDITKLNQIIMPGSHDAGMSESKNCTPLSAALSETQNLNILNQLLAGSRYFDIRPDYDKDVLVTYHRADKFGVGFGCSGQNLETVLDQSIAFLQQNPSETFILKFSHTRNGSRHSASDIAARVIQLVSKDKYKPYLFKTAELNFNIADAKINELRGKFILVFDNDYENYINPNAGIFNYQDGTSSNSGINVYDQYSDTSDLNQMMNDQISKLQSFGSLNQQYLFLLSWTLTPSNIRTSIKDLAEKANRELPSEINQWRTNGFPLPNIIYIDYIAIQDTKNIIGLNFSNFIMKY